MEDFEILQQIKTGDTNAFSLIVEKYHRHVLNFIYSVVFDSTCVEDIGQDVFISVYKSIHTFDEKRGVPFSAWIFLIARNKCISEIRKKKRSKTHEPLDDYENILDTEHGSDLETIENERRQILLDSLDQLPQPFKSMLTESIQGKENFALAQKFNISLGTVKSRLSRARDRLKKIITKKYGENSHESI